MVNQLSWVFFAAVCWVGLGTGVQLRADDEGSVTASLLEAIALNAEAVRSFDVLLRHQVIRDPEPDNYSESTRYFRIRGDWDKESFLFAVAFQDSKTIDGSIESQERKWGAIVRNGEFYMLGDNGLARWQKHHYRYYLSDISMPDLRLVGLRGFPQGITPRSLGGFEELLAALPAIRTATHATTANGYQVNFSVPGLHTPHTGRQIWNISSQTHMPIQYISNLENRDTGNVQMQCREEYEWEQINGVYVPTRIVGAAIDAIRVMNNGKSAGLKFFENEFTTHFHWFSVNEPLSDEDFSSSLLEQVSEFQKLVDPQLSKATSLIGL